MFRRDLIPLLLDRSLTVSEIARVMGLSAKEVESDLRHLLRSLKHQDYRSRITPASCRKCGFTFSPKTLGKPSKCPQCRGTWLREARIGIEPIQRGGEVKTGGSDGTDR